jgi:hypothetical protein
MTKDKRKADRRLDQSPAGRRHGHNIPPGSHSDLTKALAKANSWTWKAYTADRRNQGHPLVGRRVRSRRGGRWRTEDRRTMNRRNRVAKRDSTAGTFQHPSGVAAQERRTPGNPRMGRERRKGTRA